MFISIKLKPKVQEGLEQAATAKGLSLESYVEELIEKHLLQSDKNSGISAKEIDRLLDSLADGLESHAVLHPEGYKREGIYNNHD